MKIYRCIKQFSFTEYFDSGERTVGVLIGQIFILESSILLPGGYFENFEEIEL